MLTGPRLAPSGAGPHVGRWGTVCRRVGLALWSQRSSRWKRSVRARRSGGTGAFVGPTAFADFGFECLDVGALHLERVAELGSGDEDATGLADVGVGQAASSREH